MSSRQREASGRSVSDRGTTSRVVFTTRERRLIQRLSTPDAVQRFLNGLSYNNDETEGRPTLRSFRGVVTHRTAHCLEAVLTAATILEQHGYPPLVLSFESVDHLDHVIYVYRRAARWGAIGRSRDPGLHGRKPVFRTPRALALSYVEPYIDLTGHITAFAVVDLLDLGRYDWRLSTRNVWKVERMLQDYPHAPIRTAQVRVDRWRARYEAFTARYPGHKPMFSAGQETWSTLPPRFQRVTGRGDSRRA